MFNFLILLKNLIIIHGYIIILLIVQGREFILLIDKIIWISDKDVGNERPNL